MTSGNIEGHSADVEIIPPDMTLKYRVGGRAGTVGVIRKDAIEKAERAIERLSTDYISYARGQIAEIVARGNFLHDRDDDQATILTEISMISREIKGQARSCGYDLLTEVTESLHVFLNHRKTIDARMLEFIRAHIDVLQHIATYNLKGDGGVIGRELLSTINTARQKLETRSHLSEG